MPSETAARTGILALYLVAILSLALAPLLMPAGYDWVRHTTSESAAQGLDGAWLARLGFVAFGLAVLGSVALASWWGAVARAAHAVFAACMVATAAFSTRPWDPELPYSRVEDLLHSVTATAMGFAFALGVAVVGLARLRWGAGALALDAVALVASVAIPLAMVAVGDVAGLAQRGMFAIAFAWYLTRTLGPPLEPAGAGSRPLATGGGSG
jgi:hypothetical protein